MSSAEPWTIGRLLSWTSQYLKGHGSDSPRLDAEVLLAHVRGCPRIELYTTFDVDPGEETRTAFRELVRRRAAGEPVAYLVGQREFYSLPFRVTPDVLIGLLDRAKSFALIQTQYPEAVQQIERITPGTVSHYKDFHVSIEEIFRFDPEDTLVFRLRIESTGDQEVIYQPQRLAVRVGQDVYYASISDASGIVPPKASTAAPLAMIDGTNGTTARFASGPPTGSVPKSYSEMGMVATDAASVSPSACLKPSSSGLPNSRLHTEP